jgi:hypothetical protein
MVADFDCVDVRANLFDDAGSLVPQDHWQRIAQRAVDDLKISMTKTAARILTTTSSEAGSLTDTRARRQVWNRASAD